MLWFSHFGLAQKFIFGIDTSRLSKYCVMITFFGSLWVWFDSLIFLIFLFSYVHSGARLEFKRTLSMTKSELASAIISPRSSLAVPWATQMQMDSMRESNTSSYLCLVHSCPIVLMLLFTNFFFVNYTACLVLYFTPYESPGYA